MQHVGRKAVVLFEKAGQGKRMHGFTENYIRAELSAADSDERLDNQLVEVTLGEMNSDKTAVKVRLKNG